MAFFKKTPKKYIDLSEKLNKQEERMRNIKEANSESLTSKIEEPSNSNSGGFFNFFSAQPKEEQIESNYDSSEEKRKRLVKRVIELTKKSETQEKEISKLKERMNILEKKQRLGY